MTINRYFLENINSLFKPFPCFFVGDLTVSTAVVHTVLPMISDGDNNYNNNNCELFLITVILSCITSLQSQ